MPIWSSTPRTLGPAVAGSLLLLLHASTWLHGQEALRSAVVGDQAYRARRAPRTEQADQLKAGPVLFSAGLSYSLEWNDNVYLDSDNTKDDFIHRPQFDIRATWPATQESVLSFGVGVGYQAYTENSDLSRLLITPDSELAWDIPVKDFVFTLYDRFSYSQDVISQAAASGTAEFPRIENTVGLRGLWNPDPYRLEAGYGHYNLFAGSSDYDYLARSTEQFFGRAAYHFAAATFAGVEVSGDLTDYDSNLQSDNSGVSLGPFVEWQVTRDLELHVRGGYVRYSPDPNPITGLGEDLKSYYFGLDARHRLTDAITHGLSVHRTVQQGFNQGSGFLEVLTVRYFGSWAFYRYATVSADLLYEHGTESQRFGVSRLDEEFDRYGIGCSLRYQLLQRLSAGLSYRFTNRDSNRDSNVDSGDYQQNAVTLSASYRF